MSFPSKAVETDVSSEDSITDEAIIGAYFEFFILELREGTGGGVMLGSLHDGLGSPLSISQLLSMERFADDD